jgi:hypothetical protein
LEFQHKGGNISSFTGEKVTESQVTAAASATIAATAASLRFFTVIPQFRPEPHYEVWAEFDGTPSTDAVAMIDRISKEFDLQLAEKNIEYKTKRDSQRLTPAVGRVLPTGTYDELRRNLVSQGVPDAQIKVSHLNPKAEVRQYLESQLLQPAESGHR